MAQDQTEMQKFITIDDFELGKPLGTGRFGQVWAARHKKTGYILAIKMILISEIKTAIEVRNLRREAEIHMAMTHTNTLQMYGYFYDKTRLYYILEYAGRGDSWNILHDEGFFSEEKASTYVYNICLALRYMHSMNLIHRDLKPENILIGFDGNLKVGDFGWSVYNKDRKRLTFCGTAEYLPPEMCREEIYDKKADIWCMGILCYEYCTGSTPFAGSKSLRATKQCILSSDLDIPEYLTDECVDFITKCCQKDPSSRITLSGAIRHPFIKKYIKKSKPKPMRRNQPRYKQDNPS
ncbi:hypothetical protein ENBRE01_0689 [Enteropsectra breve]|nr:hypothetical protein ENBRE01_0689 [Enteropsectra breve]